MCSISASPRRRVDLAREIDRARDEAALPY